MLWPFPPEALTRLAKIENGQVVDVLPRVRIFNDDLALNDWRLVETNFDSIDRDRFLIDREPHIAIWPDKVVITFDAIEMSAAAQAAIAARRADAG